MKYKSSRYDIQITDQYQQLEVDFILPKNNERMIHGTVWDDSDMPQKISGAVLVIYMPGDDYYDTDPNDLKLIGYVTTDDNGEFVAGPFKVGTTVIFKIFSAENNIPNDSFEEFEYAQNEMSESDKNDDKTNIS